MQRLTAHRKNSRDGNYPMPCSCRIELPTIRSTLSQRPESEEDWSMRGNHEHHKSLALCYFEIDDSRRRQKRSRHNAGIQCQDKQSPKMGSLLRALGLQSGDLEVWSWSIGIRLGPNHREGVTVVLALCINPSDDKRGRRFRAAILMV
jgi:hypothetical protein